MSKQPEALRLADALESDPSDITGHKAASELRRLHDLLGKANALARIRAERIDELLSALCLALPILQEISDADGYTSTTSHRALEAARIAIAKSEGANNA